MKLQNNLLQKQILELEKKLKIKEELVNKYQKALTYSNERIKKISNQLTNSLSLIQSINKNLIPVQLPDVSGFEISYKFIPTKTGVSGDFFDVIKIQNSMNFGVLISSCNTYSLSSLFLSSFLKSASNINNHENSKNFLSKVIKKIKKSSIKDEKIHLFYGVFSRNTFELDYCLVGDIIAVHHQNNNNCTQLKACSNNLLQKELKLSSNKLTLQPKEALLLCSPGITSKTNEKGTRFKVSNIIHTLEKKPSAGVLEMRQNILFAYNNFGKQKNNPKDCTILVIKTKDSALRVSKGE